MGALYNIFGNSYTAIQYCTLYHLSLRVEHYPWQNYHVKQVTSITIVMTNKQKNKAKTFSIEDKGQLKL